MYVLRHNKKNIQVLKTEYEQSRKINKTASYIGDSIIDFDIYRSS